MNFCKLLGGGVTLRCLSALAEYPIPMGLLQHSQALSLSNVLPVHIPARTYPRGGRPLPP